VVHKEYAPAPKGRIVAKKVSKSTAAKRGLSLTLENPGTSGQGQYKAMPKKAGKKRERKRTIHVVGRQTFMYEDPEDREEEVEEEPAANPPPPKQRPLMADAMPKKAPTTSKAKTVAVTKPKGKTTANIAASHKNKAPLPERNEDEDDEAVVLKKLRSFLPSHDDTHPVAENMKERKDKGLKKWRANDPYAARRRTAMDYIFHTKEQRDF
jgi:hypothetical protein